jgi:hypothetical protein
VGLEGGGCGEGTGGFGGGGTAGGVGTGGGGVTGLGGLVGKFVLFYLYSFKSCSKMLDEELSG